MYINLCFLCLFQSFTNEVHNKDNACFFCVLGYILCKHTGRIRLLRILLIYLIALYTCCWTNLSPFKLVSICLLNNLNAFVTLLRISVFLRKTVISFRTTFNNTRWINIMVEKISRSRQLNTDLFLEVICFDVASIDLQNVKRAVETLISFCWWSPLYYDFDNEWAEGSSELFWSKFVRCQSSLSSLSSSSS